MIRVVINIPESYRCQAEYVFRFFSLLWGIPVEISHDSPARGGSDILYSSSHRQGTHGTILIPFDERLYDARCACDSVRRNGLTLWSASGADLDSADIIASSYRLLTFLDERQVPGDARDRRGTFLSPALPAPRQQTARLPLVDGHARHLLKQVAKSRPGLMRAALPKWPGGRKYVVALTHDTDAVTLGAAKELMTNLSKFLIQRDRTFLGMFTSGLRYIGNPTKNPFFGFPLWREFETLRRLKSCFYLFANVIPLRTDINNCKSSVVEQRIDWNILRRMAEEGWEFGFHAPINPGNKLEAFIEGKGWIEAKLGAPIYGLRHHYWALNWARPQLTFRHHIDAGFRYDTSIAWKDITGFRAATCHPFRPFDPEQNKTLDIYEVPTCLMDGHIIQEARDIKGSVRAGLDIIQSVKEQGGVAVLDWHTETACNAYNYRDYVTTLSNILEPLLEDSSVWFATPWEIVRHWQQWSIRLGVEV